MKRIVAPAMGTGIIGSLTGEQSAKAMMSAVDQYSQRGGKPISVSFVIYGDQDTYGAFSRTLTKGTYKGAGNEEGRKQLDIRDFASGMQRDQELNRRAFGDPSGRSDTQGSEEGPEQGPDQGPKQGPKRGRGLR